MSNKFVNLIHLETLMHSREVILIVINVSQIHPSHVTHNGFLVQQQCFIKVMLFLGVEL